MHLGPIYAITDPDLLPGDALLTAVESALRGGVRCVQLRDKQAANPVLLKLAHELVALCRSYQAFCLINDRVDIAAQADAHGVHLGQEDGSVRAARQTLGKKAIIGVTCHDNLALAQRAVAEGADYVAFGRFFPSATKPGAPPAPISLIGEARRQVRVPIVVIGGIQLDNLAPLVAAGADTLAICQGLFANREVTHTARELCRAYHTHARHAPDAL